MDVINLDHNATTPVLPEVWDAMRPYMVGTAGNAASSHRLGRIARVALENARDTVAQLLDAQPEEVLFTGGATEANNLAIFGLIGAAPGAIVVSPIEHPCVLEPCQQLAKRGFSLVSLPVNSQGIVEPLPTAWPADTRLACVMLANHETGAIQPVRKLAATLEPNVPLHCDAAAAAGKMPISFHQLSIASLTISAHKFHGPQGIGALLVRKGDKLKPLFFGGHQQQAKRPGTEPVALAVGLSCALERATARMRENHHHLLALRQRLLEILRAGASPMVLHGSAEDGLPHTLNISFPGCQADVLVMNLDLAGIACSTGSACSSGSLLPSPVLRAMSLSEPELRSAVRFSLSPYSALAEVEEAGRRISNAVKRLNGYC